MFDIAKKRAKDAFELLDWLDASECGGVKDAPTVVDVDAISDGDDVKVTVSYHYSGYARPNSDTVYHSVYNADDVYRDVFNIDKKDHIMIVSSEAENVSIVGKEDMFERYRQDSSYQSYIDEFEKKYSKRMLPEMNQYDDVNSDFSL